MAYWAVLGSRASRDVWLRHFLAPEPRRPSELYLFALNPWTYDAPSCKHLFPDLLAALTCPAKRKGIEEIADAAHDYGHLATHPIDKARRRRL
jgi:hypothetical protein